MKFNDLVTSKEGRFSIGQDKDCGKYYLSIPVRNRMVDYEEHYELTAVEFYCYLKDSHRASEFAEQCRRHERDDRLFMMPGKDRGVPI